MTVRRYSSISQETSLVSALNTTATTMVVNSASVLGGLTLASGERFTLVIDPDTALEEIVYAVSPSDPSSTTITIIRGVDGTGTEGTSGIAHSAGAKVRHMAIGVDFREANNHINASANVHGLASGVTVVGDTATQTLTNKTLTSPKINENVAVTATATELNILDGVTASTAELNLLDGVTATTTELNYVDGVTSAIQTQLDAKQAIVSGVSSTEIGYLDGVTSAIQTQLDGKQAVVSGVSSTEIGYLDGVTSAIQTQLDSKAPTANPTFTGTVTLPTGTVTSGMILDGTILNADINSSAAIAATKISGTAVTQADTGTVTSTMIADGTIVNGDISSSAAIAYSKLNLAGSITSADITNGTIVNADVSDTAAIAYSKLSLGGTITSADLVDGTIVNSDINASAAIALSKLATDPLARANHTGSQTASTISDFDTQVRTSKVTDLAAPTGSFSMNSQKITGLATPTDNTDASTKAYVDTKVSDLINGAPSTLDTLKEIADAISSGGTFYDAVLLKAGGTMTGALTLSGAPTVDLHAATKAYVDTVAGSATAAAASAAAAATTYDNFDDRYLGSKSTAPTVDNDGNAILEGAIYWNSVTNAMYAWTGTEWGSISSTADIYRFRFTASGGETSISGTDDNGLTLAYIPGKEQVYLNGVLLARTSDYSATDGSSITSLSALAASDILEVITFTAFELADSIARSLFDAKGDILVATSADTPGKLTAGTNGQYLQADSSTATGLKWATVSGYSAPTLGSTSIASGATVTTISGLTDIVLNGPGSVTDELTLLLMGAL